jgi:hypothetical protein
MTTITIYCPACRQWSETDKLPEVGDKVVHGCGYEATVSGIDSRSWVRTAEIRPAVDHVPAEGYPDNSTTRQLQIMRQRAEDEAEQARATSLQRIVTFAREVRAAAKDDEVVVALIDAKVPEAKMAVVAAVEEPVGEAKP